MSNIIKLMRPHQYIKNLFIFIPLFFAMKITDIYLLSQTLLAFIAFCFTASAIYILNDYHDINEDRAHPTKRFRPLASGEVSKDMAIRMMSVLSLLGFGIMAILSIKAFFILVLYVILNIAYSFRLKHIAIIDIVIIALGFVLRLFVGAIVANIELSAWIVVMTFLLALFMALAKRRDDVLIFNQTGKKMRRVIDGYNLQFLDTAMAIMAAVVIVAYTIYTTSPQTLDKFHSKYLYLTAFFVIVGVMRYLQITFVYEDSGSPTKIVLKDKFMQFVLIGWVLTFVWIIY